MPKTIARSRVKSEYLVEKQVHLNGTLEADEQPPIYWTSVAAGESFEDTAAALKYIAENKVEGHLRIVAVKKSGTTEKQQVTKLAWL